MSFPPAPVKTASGLDEIRHRTRGLGQRHRTVLFLVDGRRPLGEVLALAHKAGATTVHLEDLVRLGLVEIPVEVLAAEPLDTMAGALDLPRLTSVELEVPELQDAVDDLPTSARVPLDADNPGIDPATDTPIDIDLVELGTPPSDPDALARPIGPPPAPPVVLLHDHVPDGRIAPLGRAASAEHSPHAAQAAARPTPSPAPDLSVASARARMFQTRPAFAAAAAKAAAAAAEAAAAAAAAVPAKVSFVTGPAGPAPAMPAGARRAAAALPHALNLRDAPLELADHARPRQVASEDALRQQVRSLLVAAMGAEAALFSPLTLTRVLAAQSQRQFINLVWEIERHRHHPRRSHTQLLALQEARELLGMGNTLVAGDSQPGNDWPDTQSD